jgi:hypothetical protein
MHISPWLLWALALVIVFWPALLPVRSEDPDEHADRAEAAYFDESYPERLCDYCGKPYRGPAVYCALRCAIADA